MSADLTCVRFHSSRVDSAVSFSWDSCVRLYDVRHDTAVERARHSVDAPITSGAYVDDNIIAASIDGAVSVINAASGISHWCTRRHRRGASSLCVSSANVYMSGGWDGAVITNDTRMSAAATADQYEIGDGGKVFALTALTSSYHIAAACDRRRLLIFDRRKLSEPILRRQSALAQANRAITAVEGGIAVGSVCGRVAVEPLPLHISGHATAPFSAFAFKTCRGSGGGGGGIGDASAVLSPVNAIRWCPRSGRLYTACADGAVDCWDVVTKRRTAAIFTCDGVTDMDVSADGQRIAIAQSYSYHFGPRREAVTHTEVHIRRTDAPANKENAPHKGLSALHSRSVAAAI